MKKVDLLIQNGWVYLTYRQCFKKMDIAVVGERIYDISPASCYEADQIVDAEGKYVIPGLIDIHMHIESSMTYPEEFSRAVLPWGVTTVVADPHEIVNVFGISGMNCFMDQKTELDIYYGIPSSVPSTGSEYETSGGEIGEEEVKELLKDSRVLCLGEVMNASDILSKEDTRIKRIIRLCQNADRMIRIEGHCPSLTGEELSGFIRGGVDADHTQQSPESVLEKTDLGMFLELQEKSLTPQVVKTVCSYNLYENIALVTDDIMPDQLIKGHLNRNLSLAVSHGMPPEKAIYCATFTPARRMGLNDRGMIAPGKQADLLILNDLTEFVPFSVYKSGKQIEPKASTKSKVSTNAVKFPDHYYQSVNCRMALFSDFRLNRCKIKNGTALVHVMQIQKFGTRSVHKKRLVPVRDGCLCWKEAGLCLMTVWERYGKTGAVSYGLVEGGFSASGAVATTWSHDSHNLMVLGNSEKDMVLAQNHVVHLQGGYVTARDGKITAAAPLPVGGILSDQGMDVLSNDLKAVRDEVESMGYCNNNVIMSLSTLTLLVSPELKLSDKGLFDVRTKKEVSLVEKYVSEKEKG